MRGVLLVLPLLLTATLAEAGFEAGQRAEQAGDLATAFAEYSEAAVSGDPMSQFALGMAYLQGRGTSADPEKAVAWLADASDAGYAPAQFMMGYLLQTGGDFADAISFYEAAAGQGHALAQANLGQIYAEGLGVAPDSVKAYMWLTLAARYGLEDALQRRAGVATRMATADIATGEQLAADWVRQRQ